MNRFAQLWKRLAGRGKPSEQATPRVRLNETPADRHAERRREPRVKVLSALDGYGIELEVKVVVREVSPGGFSVESPAAFEAGTDHTFLFSTSDGTETMVRCTCRHAHTVKGAHRTYCIAGFQFLPNQDANLKVILDLYAHLRELGLE